MDNNEIRRKILEILCKYEQKYPGRTANPQYFYDNLGITDKNEILTNLRYLHQKRYIRLITARNYFAAEITSSGRDIVENNEKLNRQFPINFTQNIVSNSPGTVINSNNLYININESFNQLYVEVNEKNPNNKVEIHQKIEELRKELQKEEVSKSKITNCYNWLNRNANWTIPTITQIILTALTGGS